MTDLAPTFANTGVLTHHDPGCRCWPHVSEKDALDAIAAVALNEYRDGLRRTSTAAPRQGEPVDLDVERLARAIEREIHVDPEHGFPPSVDSRYLANAIADHYDHPAEPVAPDKEGNG